MEETRKVIVDPLIVATISALCTVIAAMAIYFVALKKSDKREAKENLTKMTDVLLKNAESNMALSTSIDRSREQQDRISQETSRVLMSMTEKLIELKNGKH